MPHNSFVWATDWNRKFLSENVKKSRVNISLNISFVFNQQNKIILFWKKKVRRGKKQKKKNRVKSK